MYSVLLDVVADNHNMLPVQKQKAKIAQYQYMWKIVFFLKSEVKKFIH